MGYVIFELVQSSSQRQHCVGRGRTIATEADGNNIFLLIAFYVACGLLLRKSRRQRKDGQLDDIGWQ